MIFKYYFKIYSYLFNKYLHYGDFYIDKDISYIIFLDKISKPSNILNKITIIEGWSKTDLNKELKKHFKDYKSINYTDILADTYYFNKNESFEIFLKKLKDFKYNYFTNIKNNKIFNNYNQSEIIIIGSLLEKEGLDYLDKKKISSVIFNRLEKRMKLQIDATVEFAITNGDFKLKRRLTYDDLKIDNLYNTYKIKGLPPGPISYVGSKTIEIILENYKSDFLFYYFDDIKKSHEFSINYENHKSKLNEYRNKK